MSNSPSNPDFPDRKFMESKTLEPEILEPEALWTKTPTSPNQPPPYASAPKRFPWGCLISGCLTVFLLMVGGIVAVGFGSVWFYNQQIAQYTSEEARPLPLVEVSEQELEQLESRVEAFQEKVDKGEVPQQLVLNADEINALISQQEKLRGKVFVTIADDLVQAEVSIPTSSIPGGQGRYFNGSVSVNASLEDGVLIVTLQVAEVNGQPVPEPLMRALRQENLAKDLYKNPDLAKKLSKFESLVIEGDRIILTPKQSAAAGESVDMQHSPEQPAAATESTPPAEVDSQPQLPAELNL